MREVLGKFHATASYDKDTNESTPVSIMLNWPKYMQYLQYVPIQEKHNIFGCQWFNVAWKPSKQLVWASEDKLIIPDSNILLPKMTSILSKAGVPKMN
jgi:hypothetical protein